MLISGDAQFHVLPTCGKGHFEPVRLVCITGVQHAARLFFMLASGISRDDTTYPPSLLSTTHFFMHTPEELVPSH